MIKFDQHRDIAKTDEVNFFYFGELGYFLLSIFQIVILAYFFGTRTELDYYLIAYLIPHFIVIAYEGIIKGGVVPKFLELKKDYDAYTAWRYFWQIVVISILIVLAVMVVFLIFGRLILGFLALGLRQKDPQTVIKIFNYLMLGTIFANTSTVFKEVYLSQSEYRHPTIGKMLQTLILIVSVIAYTDEFGIYSLVFGFTVGYLFEFLYLAMPFRDYLNHGKEFYLFFKSNAVKETFKKAVPYLLTATFLYLNIIVDRFIAGFGKNPGSISALNYAFSLSFKVGV